MTALPSVSHLQGWRAGLLWFPDPQSPKAQHESDGLLVTAREADGVVRIQALGSYRELAAHYPELPVTHWPGLCIAPGFVDLHTHYPQTDVIGSPADGLLPWLERYTFPHEKQFADPAYAHEVTGFFLDELMRHGVTTALCFATAHPESVDAFMAQAQKRQLRMITGKVLQDRHSPDGHSRASPPQPTPLRSCSSAAPSAPTRSPFPGCRPSRLGIARFSSSPATAKPTARSSPPATAATAFFAMPPPGATMSPAKTAPHSKTLRKSSFRSPAPMSSPA
jgi:hypothetical protein